MKQQTTEKQLQFQSMCEISGTIFIDSELMTQALVNIFSNAIDATDAGGTISFVVNRKGREIQFIVRDTGCGIPKESLEKIFNLYYTTKTNGNGIGLAITQQIISQHNGRIEVQSKAGKGTTFTITIPEQR